MKLGESSLRGTEQIPDTGSKSGPGGWGWRTMNLFIPIIDALCLNLISSHIIMQCNPQCWTGGPPLQAPGKPFDSPLILSHLLLYSMECLCMFSQQIKSEFALTVLRMSLSHGVLWKKFLPRCQWKQLASESSACRTQPSKYNLSHLPDEFTLNKNMFFSLLLKDEAARAKSGGASLDTNDKEVTHTTG